jgi:hypothetical protein
MSHSSEVAVATAEFQNLNRREIVSKGLQFFGAVVLGSTLIPNIASAEEQPIADETFHASHKHHHHHHEMPLGLSMQDLVGNDPSLLTSGNFQDKYFWAQTEAALVIERGPLKEHEKVPLTIPNEVIKQVFISGRKFIVMESEYDPKTARRGHAPTDRSMHGPYANYLRGVIGSNLDAAGIQVVNEPEYAFSEEWNKKNRDGPKHVAEMIKLADKICKELDYSGVLLGPGTSDKPGPDGGIAFSIEVAKHLRGYKFHTEFANVIHLYESIKTHSLQSLGTTTALEKHIDCHGTYVSESGYVYYTVLVNPAVKEVYEYDPDIPLDEQEAAQAAGMTWIYPVARKKRIRSLANYSGEDDKDGGGGFMCGYFNYDSQPHPVYDEIDTLLNGDHVSEEDLKELDIIERDVDRIMA